MEVKLCVLKEKQKNRMDIVMSTSRVVSPDSDSFYSYACF